MSLDLDDVPPLPLRPAFVPHVLAAAGAALWLLDLSLPTLVRIEAPGAVRRVTRCSYPGRVATGPVWEDRRQLHADPDGCWITGPDGVWRASNDGAVTEVDRRPVERSWASAGTLLARHDRLTIHRLDGERHELDLNRLLGAEACATAPDGAGGFVLMPRDPGSPDGTGPFGRLRLVHLDRDGVVTHGPEIGADPGPMSPGPRLLEADPVALVDRERDSTVIRRVGDPDGGALVVGRPCSARTPVWWWPVTAAGRVFVVGPLPGPRPRYTSGDPPVTWWPLPGPVARVPGQHRELLTELDPHSAEPIGTTVVPRFDHLAVDGHGTVWITAHQTVHRCPPEPGGVAEPVELA